MTSRRLALFALGLAVPALLLGAWLSWQVTDRRAHRPDIPGLLWPDPKQVAPFELTDQRQQPFGLERLKGKWTFMFFGYTHCPDVCPMTLSVFQTVHRQLEDTKKEGSPVQFAFVSVDPERDTPEHLAKYVGYFNPDFVGATGNETQLSELTRQLGVLHRIGEQDEAGNYLVDHTAAILLTDPRARLVALFRMPHDPSQISEQFSEIRQFIGG